MTHQHTHEHAHGHEHRTGWDQRYASTPRLFSVAPDETLVDLAGAVPPGRALDLGAGEGRNSLWLARKGWRVTAVDLSTVALERLAVAAREEDLDVETVVADMAGHLAGGRQYDLVVLAYIHPAPAERPALLAAAASAVAPGGHLFLVGHHLDSLGHGGPPDPERLYDEGRLDGAFPGLDVLRLERREGQEGDTGHAQVDVVAWAARPVGEGVRQ